MGNKIKTNPEAIFLFSADGPAGASPGVAGVIEFTPEGLDNGSGWKSDVLDLGAGVRNNLFEWRAKFENEGTPILGGVLHISFTTSDDGVIWDANLGSGNQVVTNLEKRRNCQRVGSISIDDEASGVPFISSGLVNLYSRYVAVAWWNLTGNRLTPTAGTCLFQITPVPDEIQALTP